MQAFLVASLTLINLLLWLVFFIKFKKLFSTDNIMQKFHTEMEQLLSDVQRQTANSINLLEEKKKEAKAQVAEAERKIAIAEKRLATLKSEKALAEQGALLQSQIAAQTAAAEKPRAKKKSPAKTAAEKYKKNSSSHVASLPSEDAVYALTGLFKENAQKSLFGEDGQSVTVTNDGDAYGKIPLVKPEIVVSDNPIVPKKSFSWQVKELSELGSSVEEISAKTGRTTTEVELALAML